MASIAAFHALELRLTRSVLFRLVAAIRTCPRSILRSNFDHRRSSLLTFPVQPLEKFSPTLIQYRTVQTRFLSDFATRRLRRPRGTARHVLYLQVFTIDHRVFFAQIQRHLVDIVLTDVADSLMQLRYRFPLFFPVLAELLFA